MKRAAKALLILCLTASLPAAAQTARRPRLLGIAQIAVRSKDLGASRHFYGGVLGFEEAFAVRKDLTAVVGSGLPAAEVSELFFKVNNRQYIVVIPESSADEPRLARYAIVRHVGAGCLVRCRGTNQAWLTKIPETSVFRGSPTQAVQQPHHSGSEFKRPILVA